MSEAVDSATTLPQIPEQGAPPHIAAIYADIRKVSGLPVVNLIWRHFASLPGVLPWAWAAVAPIVGSSAMDAARQRMAASIPLPLIAIPGDAAWHNAGAAEQDVRDISALNEAYVRGNLTNILVLTGLRLRLEHPDRAAAPLPPGPAAPHAPAPLPTLPRIDDLDASLAARIRALAALHGAERVTPSLYLALAPWPGVVHAIPDWLSPLYEPAALQSARASTCRLAEAASLLPAPAPLPDGVAAMRPALQLFTRIVIPDLILVGFALRRVLPAQVDTTLPHDPG